jgi:formylmethanofuran dehydrogenase subunit E
MYRWEDVTENGMILDAYHEYDIDGRPTGSNPYRQHECDRCGAYIYPDDESFHIEEELVCLSCYEKHEECVGEE